eukprot:3909323-Pyramimonas_sp.AAC.1
MRFCSSASSASSSSVSDTSASSSEESSDEDGEWGDTLSDQVLELPFIVRERFRITTWNTHTLFGSIYADVETQARTRATVMKLCEKSDIVVLQECHGCREDLGLLLADVQHFRGWGTFLSGQAAGGTRLSPRGGATIFIFGES